MSVRIVFILIVMLLAVAAPSLAQAKTLAPPGTSGVDQYLETVPDAKGDRPGGSGGTGHHQLPAATRQALEAAGPEGRRVAALATSTGPRRLSGQSGSSEKPAAKESAPAASDRHAGGRSAGGGRSPLSTALTVATANQDSGGMGLLLPIILLITTLGAVMVAVKRRRTG